MFHLLFHTNARPRSHPTGHWQEAVTQFSQRKDESSILYRTPQTLAAVLHRSAVPGLKPPQAKCNGQKNAATPSHRVQGDRRRTGSIQPQRDL